MFYERKSKRGKMLLEVILLRGTHIAAGVVRSVDVESEKRRLLTLR